ncbi:MAG: hypothetical protein KBC57_11975 [Neisseriaceae bacterium]|nr:hypothetical protein [Neisseriaceae bacterium]MBP6863054.1 hypothetical protein [Neisseriaceae bacterium]
MPLLSALTACDLVGTDEAEVGAVQPASPAVVREVTGYYFNNDDVLTYLHPVRMFEERGLYERSDGSLEVLHADIHNLVIKLHPLVLPDDRDDIKQALVDQALLYGVLKVFTHTEVEWLDIQVSPLSVITGQKQPLVQYAASPKRHIALSRAQATAFLRAYSSARTFSDLVDTDKNWHHLRGADSLIFTDLYYTPEKPSQLAEILSQQYAHK